MATGAAGGGIYRSLYNDGCITGHDGGIQRRPYHRNCSCALHNTRGYCGHASQNTKVSYPMRRNSSEGCLSLMASEYASWCVATAVTLKGKNLNCDLHCLFDD
ncbi:hypothetical protein DCAR_0625432 [Daucus carota subsp. sativus]|uniref:Uncharacterized protein n=1 Tax=Daucus carota subsp. sativus TaxID=79200 RepID=A0A164WFU3_DAUCS|nr:hypothetical protein DCAR_0625432 [Daucus carota subsp. sativus]